MNRPATRGPLPTDEDVNRLAEYPGGVGRRARIERDIRTLEALDFPVGCQVGACNRPADWEGHGRCPRCDAGMFQPRPGQEVIFVCDPCRTKNMAQLARMDHPGCSICHRSVSLAEIHASMSWTRVPR